MSQLVEKCRAYIAATAAVMTVIMAVVFHCDVAEADPTTYYVGDSLGGWTPDVNVAHWAHHKTFHVGDKLVFRYDPHLFNVAVVNKFGYKKCVKFPSNAITYSSGQDVITLDHVGSYYFICNADTRCCDEGGMKLNVYINSSMTLVQ